MKNKLKTLKTFKILTIVLIAVLAGLLSVLGAGMKNILHMSDRERYDSGNEVQSVLLPGTGRAFVVFSDASDTERGRYIGRLNLDLYPRDERPLNLKATVWTAESVNGEEVLSSTVIEDVNPLYVRTEVLSIGRENVISVELETTDGAAFSVGNVAIDNRFHFNSYLFLFVTLLSFAVLFSVREVLNSIKEEERCSSFARSFLVTALSAGIALTVCLPAGKVGYDEETHLQAVLQIASFPSGELHVSDGIMRQVTVTEYNNPAAQPSGAAEQLQYASELAEVSDYRSGSRTPDFTVLWNRVPSYLPMAVALKAGKGLGLDWNVLLVLARLANLLTYAALMTLAVAILPSGQALMALIGLLPQNLFLASTISYDPFITGCLSLGTAFCFRLLSSGEETGKKQLVTAGLMLLCFVLGSLPKAVYAPLVLLAVMIPFRRERNQKKKWIITAVLFGVCASAFLAFVIPTLLHPSAGGDIRGGAVSEMSQLEFVFSAPLTYTGILLSQMFRWFPQCLFGADCTVFLGHLSNNQTAVSLTPVPWLILIVFLVAAGIVSIALKKRKPELALGERGWILFLVFSVSALIWTAMYVSFTVPGAREIAGVQGRYFIPLMFPFYYALGAELPVSKGALLVRKEQMCYHLMMVIMAVLLGIQFFNAVILPYCM